jgi:hypothetical protein
LPDETTAPFVDETPPAPMLPPLEPQHSRTNGYIKTVALEKRFGASKVVDDFSLHVDKGEIYGLLGPNGVRVEVPVNNVDAQGVTPALRANSDFLARRAAG